MEKLISKIKYYLLLILVVLIGISYHPYFFMDEEVDIRSGISIYIIGLTLLVTALSVKVKVFSNKIILNYFVYLLFFICITLVLVSLNYSMPFDEIRKISIPLASIIIGYNLSLKSRYYIILI